MNSVICRDCGRESFSREFVSCCPHCKGSVDLIFASQAQPEQTRLNRLNAALEVVKRDEKYAYERYHALKADAATAPDVVLAAKVHWQELDELIVQLLILIDDESDLQELLNNILQSSSSFPESIPLAKSA